MNITRSSPGSAAQLRQGGRPTGSRLYLSGSAGRNATSNKTKQAPREFELREVRVRWVRLRQPDHGKRMAGLDPLLKCGSSSGAAWKYYLCFHLDSLFFLKGTRKSFMFQAPS